MQSFEKVSAGLIIGILMLCPVYYDFFLKLLRHH